MNTTIRAPGRNITVGDAVRRRNPHLFEKLDPEAKVVLDTAPLKKRLRQDPKPLLNKLESEFKEYHEGRTGHTLFSQSVRFRLGNGIWYKPDFIQFCSTLGVTAFEVKGPHSFRGGFENLKVAASLYQKVRWLLVWKQDGEWRQQEVLP